MARFDRITFDPKLMGGRACIRGVRIPVSIIVGQREAGMTKIDHVTITDEAARFVEAQVAAGRFPSVDDALTAAVEALKQRDGLDADRAAMLRAAWEGGMESMHQHGPQLESDAEFNAFMDECETDAARQ